MLLATTIFGIDLMLILVAATTLICLAFVSIYAYDMLKRWRHSRVKPTAAALGLFLLYGSFGSLATVSVLRRVLPRTTGYEVAQEIIVSLVVLNLLYVFIYFLRVRHAETNEEDEDKTL